MKYYIIIVEGAHDIATVERILRMQGINECVKHKSELPDVWKRMIPDKFPFHADLLDRITPLPSFWQNEFVSVAIKNAGSDVQLVSCLKEICQSMKLSEKEQLEKVLIICDADAKAASEKKKFILENCEYDENFRLSEQENSLQLMLDEISEGKHLSVTLDVYVFPDDENPGTLEDVLLEAAEEVYPDLFEKAEQYINTINVSKYKEVAKTSKRKKAQVGCIANVLRPGKANQSAVADTKWISEESIQGENVKKLYRAIERFISS